MNSHIKLVAVLIVIAVVIGWSAPRTVQAAPVCVSNTQAIQAAKELAQAHLDAARAKGEAEALEAQVKFYQEHSHDLPVR
jgi:hypothetical protein